jgi:hypothetical protein
VCFAGHVSARGRACAETLRGVGGARSPIQTPDAFAAHRQSARAERAAYSIASHTFARSSYHLLTQPAATPSRQRERRIARSDALESWRLAQWLALRASLRMSTCSALTLCVVCAHRVAPLAPDVRAMGAAWPALRDVGPNPHDIRTTRRATAQRWVLRGLVAPHRGPRPPFSR